jgi:RNA polymerase sigma factor (sigma-70 family)
MSPAPLRRYRAERLLRAEFAALRGEVLGHAQRRLRARGVHLDGGDLEGCYSQAWAGLYAAVAAGEEIANPGGWLTVVTYRRALDEHRAARARARAAQERAPGEEPDLAAALDDRARLRQLFEGLRGRLTPRECEAASLCYLQGLTRAQAAARMGLSEARMTKLMEGGPRRPGVAGKVGELLEAIRGGRWCEQQGSLMRGFAFGILDPAGERYRLARAHQRECPACRAYVLALRGLAAVLPPLPLPWGLGGPGPRPAVRTPHGHAGGGVTAGTSAAAGAGAGSAAGGSWLLGGSVGAKVAVGCLLALSVSCVVLVAPRAPASHRGAQHATHRTRTYLADAPGAAAQPAALGGPVASGGALTERARPLATHVSPAARGAAARRAAARHALREFGLEQPAPAASAGSPRPAPATAHVAAVHPTSPGTPSSAPSGPPSHAEREFGPE